VLCQPTNDNRNHSDPESLFVDRNQGNRQEANKLWICIEEAYNKKGWLSSLHRIRNEFRSSSQEAQVTYR
jgi:hypothetical protein